MIHRHLTINEKGLVFGENVLSEFSGDKLQIDELRALSLLSVAMGKAISPAAMGYIRCAERHHRLGNSVMRDMALALTGVPTLQKVEQIKRLTDAIAFLDSGKTPLELLKNVGIENILDDANAYELYKYVSKFNPNHKPAGTPDGDQFSTGGEEIGSAVIETKQDSQRVYRGEPDNDRIEPDYTIEKAIAFFGIGRILSALKASTAGTSGNTINDAMNAIQDYLGGEGKTIRNSDGDMILMRNDKKIRFDINDPHGYDPHFHIEELNSDGDWIDAGDKHHYNFKDK